MNSIKEYIERQAEINVSETLIELSQELKDERQIIVNFLVIKEVIVLDQNGGFHFIGEDSVENKEVYLCAYNNF